MQHRVDDLDYLQVYALNYTHINFEKKTSVILGTEQAWLLHYIEQDLHNQIAPRLRDSCYYWDKSQLHTQAYAEFMQQHQPELSWMKTDLCIQDEHGYHLLEIGHSKELGIDTIQQFEDTLDAFKHEAIRLQQKYPQMIFPLTCLNEIQDYQALYAEQDKEAMEKMKINFDMSLFEPIPEPTLTEQEDEALKLRVMWHEDDEIADKMGLSILETKALFNVIKDKYQQPKIPQRVYVAKMKQVLNELNGSKALLK